LAEACEGLEDGAAPRGSQAKEAVKSRLAYSPRRHINDAEERDRVVGVSEHAEVGQEVLDLLALIELGGTNKLVGHAVAHELLLHHAALLVRAVHDSNLAVSRGHSTRLDEPPRLPCDEGSLLLVVPHLMHMHRRAARLKAALTLDSLRLY
jgi:hypothetical protein